MTKTLLLLSLLAVASLACHKPASDEASSAPLPESAPAVDSGATAESEPPIEYEPAYPTDVSSEALSEGDVAQQKTTHSHGDGDEHSHEEEGEDHDDDGAHDDHQR